MGVVSFIRIGRVNSCAPWVSSVHLGIVGRGSSVHSVTPWRSSGSFVSLGFSKACPGGRRVHSGSLDIFVRAMGVVGFILVRWVH